MECPECQGKTLIIDSRKYLGAVYRRRKCKNCGFSFYTEETETEDAPRMIKEAWADSQRKSYKNNKRR